MELIDQFPHFRIAAVSSLYHSPPWGDADQPDFLNAVLVGYLNTTPQEFLQHLIHCEDAIGKAPVRRWGPRLIDLDLLAVDDEVCDSAELQLPHPRIAGRPFVYLPLREACAGLTLPDSWHAHLDASEEGRALEATTRRLELQGPFPSRQFELLLHGEEATAKLARALADALKPGCTIALTGPLGAGKSVFARAMARQLGIAGPLPSPTYTLCREYTSGRLTLQHWDFYRLETPEDLESAGFPPAPGEFDVLAIEWADRFPEALAAQTTIRVHIEPVPDENEHRRITVRLPSGFPTDFLSPEFWSPT